MPELALQEIRRRYQAGEAIEAIADDAQVSSNTVRHHLNSLGVERRRVGQPSASADRARRDGDFLAELYRRGVSSVELASLTGADVATTTAIVLEHGAELRRAGQRTREQLAGAVAALGALDLLEHASGQLRRAAPYRRWQVTGELPEVDAPLRPSSRAADLASGVPTTLNAFPLDRAILRLARARHVTLRALLGPSTRDQLSDWRCSGRVPTTAAERVLVHLDLSWDEVWDRADADAARYFAGEDRA